eukprot:950765-Heterocapsa_arctica.AAC.1
MSGFLDISRMYNYSKLPAAIYSHKQIRKQCYPPLTNASKADCSACDVCKDVLNHNNNTNRRNGLH